MMDDVTRKRYERRLQEKLAPGAIKENLLGAALFLVVYELLKTEVIEKTRGFFCTGFDQTGLLYSPNYDSQVLALDRNRIKASCLWLAHNGAISEADIDVAQAIADHRHAVAHELPRFLVDPDAHIDHNLLLEAHRLITALGRFWGRIEVDTNSEFDGHDVRDEDIKSGAMLLMEHILVVLGQDGT